jgi:hypothetical protein
MRVKPLTNGREPLTNGAGHIQWLCLGLLSHSQVFRFRQMFEIEMADQIASREISFTCRTSRQGFWRHVPYEVS